MASSRLILWLGAIVAILLPLAPSSAAERVQLELVSGRHVSGVIDARSTDEQLWLRSGDAAASLTRPIAWDRIASAEHNKQSISLDDLRALAETAAAAPDAAAATPHKWHGVIVAPARREVTPTPVMPDVRSVNVDAFHANWDADVESDGLVLLVAPLSASGAVVPVSGSLQVELIAPEVRRFQDAPHGRGLTLERVAQWTVQVAPEAFTAGGMRVELPFQAIHPGFDTKILPHGLVHARLVVPGQGTFDTTAEFIRLRPWSPLRDKYYRDTGRRFFPTEQTGRPK